ncbi:MAG TPA: ATP-binding protein [Spirochaetia bacterium]|nr:ATP-binding protein [Spirochaetia bacterium]
MATQVKILYIEDDPGLARLVQTKLAPEGYRVESAPSGGEGLQTFDEGFYDLVIVDYHLPDGNGLDVLRKLVSKNTGVPVIMATGAGSEEIAVTAMKLGAADYINKESYDKFFRLLPSVIEKALRQAEMARQKLRAEADLRESEERLRSILMSMDDAVLVADRNGLLVASRSPGSAGAAVTASPDWIGRTFSDVFPPAVAARFEAAFSGARSSDSVEQFDYCLNAGPVQVWYNAKVSPLKDDAGTFDGVTIVARDVTARKRAEDQLTFAIQAADAANRAKSDLLAGMSHELRTPLTAIMGYAEILLYEYFGSVNERQKQQLDVILQCSHHLLDLINDILDISKIESGKTELELSSVKISSLLAHTLTLLRETAGRHRIVMETNLPPELKDLEMRVDERRLKQVLFNLLSNAIKFTPDGGRINVAMERHGGFVEISVTDTGVGVPALELERIFEAFYQLRRGGTAKSQGSGLGLSLARQLVELHGGRIWAESEGEGKGSRFVFTLPLGP